MYLDFFHFKQAPFSITPDPEFVYLSEKHQESLAHLVYGVTRGGGAGFVQLTGEVGTGKTTISRLFLEKLPENTQAALLLNPNITPIELLENIFKEFDLPIGDLAGRSGALITRLNEHLLAWYEAGKNTVIIIDEAQNLPRDTLEQLRLLTNLETSQQKLLQIILIGQPELKTTMQRRDLRQLAQRITSRFHLQALSESETMAYINHRLAVAGVKEPLFSQSVIRKIHHLTDGTPRLINTLCDRALLAAFVDESPRVLSKHISTAATEVLAHQPVNKLHPIWFMVPILAIIGWLFWSDKNLPHDLQINSNINVPEANQNNEWVTPANAISWQQYYQLWHENEHLLWSNNRCPDADILGMGCLRRQGNLNQIEKLNTPVLLELTSERLLLLKRKDNDRWLVLTDRGYVSVPSNKIESLWLGTYYVIWPMAPELISDTMSESLTKWVITMAEVIDNETIDTTEAVNQWVTQFQQQHGLLADGIVGQETQMALSLKAYQGPRLSNTKE